MGQVPWIWGPVRNDLMLKDTINNTINNNYTYYNCHVFPFVRKPYLSWGPFMIGRHILHGLGLRATLLGNQGMLASGAMFSVRRGPGRTPEACRSETLLVKQAVLLWGLIMERCMPITMSHGKRVWCWVEVSLHERMSPSDFIHCFVGIFVGFFVCFFLLAL